MKLKKISNIEHRDHIKKIEVDGYTVIPKFLNKEEINHTKTIIKEVEKDFCANYSHGRIIFGLETSHKWFLDLADHHDLSKILMYFINDPHFGTLPSNVPNYHIGYCLGRTTFNDALATHIDSYVPNQSSFPLIMQTALSIEDQSKNNGNTYLIPKSHLSGSYPKQDYEYPNTLDLYPKKGDLVIWDSRIWHGTRPNFSDATRWSIITTYMRWWIKPRLDATKNIKNEYYNSLTPRQKALLGFCSIPPHDPKTRFKTRIGYEELPESI